VTDAPDHPALTEALVRAKSPSRRVVATSASEVPKAVLEQQQRAVLAERQGSGLWVFAYGALLWERKFACDEERVGRLQGMVRRYCLWDDRDRGTPDKRSLTLGLEPGAGRCGGAALHLPERCLDEALRVVWQHEMAGGLYEARWVDVDTAAGIVGAITFVADPLHPCYAGALPAERVAGILAATAGPNGPAASYLLSTAEWLRARGEPDPELDQLCALVAERLSEAGDA